MRELMARVTLVLFGTVWLIKILDETFSGHSDQGYTARQLEMAICAVGFLIAYAILSLKP